MTPMLETAQRLAALGFAVHWLRGPNAPGKAPHGYKQPCTCPRRCRWTGESAWRGKTKPTHSPDAECCCSIECIWQGVGKQPIAGGWQKAPAASAEELRQSYRASYNVGIHTGLVEGASVCVIVVDIDSPAAMVEAKKRLPTTPIRTITSSGEHWYYRHPGGKVRFGNKAHLGGVALDIRGDGGQVVCAPSVHPLGHGYREAEPWTEASVAAMPVFDVSWFPAPMPARQAPPVAARQAGNAREERWAQAALKDEATDVANAPEGARNDTLVRAAYAIGQIVGGGYLGEAEARQALREGGRACGLPEDEIEQTIERGLAAGKLKPRSGPEERALPPARAAAPAPVPSLPPALPALPDLPSALPPPRMSRSATDHADIFNEPAPVLIPSAFERLSKALGGGYQSHSIVILNGGTKHGKSSKALQEARHKAEIGIPVLFVSLEMTRREILSRLASQRLPAAHQEINRTYWAPSRAKAVNEALAGLEALRIADFKRGMTISAIFDEVKRLADDAGGAPFVVLDYLQRILSRVEDGKQDRRVAMGRLSDELAEACRSLGATFLVLSAIPRSMYGSRSDDLADDELNAASKESGEIEYDAGAVLFLRKLPERAPDGRPRAVLRVTASRYSATDGQPINLLFDGAHNLFEEDAEDGLGEVHLSILRAIDKEPGRNQQALARALDMRKAEMGKAIELLTRLSLVAGAPPKLTPIGLLRLRK